MTLDHNTRPESLNNFERLMQADGFDLDSAYQAFVVNRPHPRETAIGKISPTLLHDVGQFV